MSGTANGALWPDGKWGGAENVLLCGGVRRGVGGGERLCVYLFTALKVATLCPLVLPVTLGYRQDRALGTEGGEVVGIGLCYCWV